VSKHGTGDNGKPMNDLVYGTRSEVGAFTRKSCISSGKKAEYPSKSGFRSLNPFDFLTKEDEKSILLDLQESDDDVDVENSYDETTTSSKSLGNSTGGNT
ncbi:hypothetical protein Tco_0037396, partial [Tanacetum coccineum]